MKTALIVGATGLVGKHCLKTLLDSDQYSKVVVLSRRPVGVDLRSQYGEKLDNLVIDFDNLDHLRQQITGDDIYCCLGTTLKQAGSVAAFRKVDYDYCLQLAEICKAKGAKQFIIVTAVNSKANSFAYYSKIKGQLQNKLVKLGFQRLSIFQPSFLIGSRDKVRLAESAVGAATELMSNLLTGKMTPYKAIEGEVVARSMVASAELPLQEGSEVNYYQYDKMQTLARAS